MTFSDIGKRFIPGVYYYFVKVTTWVLTNWRIRVKKFKDNRLEEFLVYESHCWNCLSNIDSEKQFYKYGLLIVSEWVGAKKCQVRGCNYFICPKCGKCLHESPDFDVNRFPKPRYTMYVRINDKRFHPTQHKVYEYGVRNVYLDRLYEMKRRAKRLFNIFRP